METHKFWKTQPVNEPTVQSMINGPVKNLTNDDFSNDPLPLPEGFKWYTFDINNDKDLDDIYNFLHNYYSETDDHSIRLGYRKESIKWFLQCPNYYPDLHIGVKFNDKIIGTIFGVPRTVNVFDKKMTQIEINFLCVREALRNKRLAPLLIKEVSRRVSQKDIWQAFYTSAINLPNVIGSGLYYNRYINIKKMVDIKFTRKPEKLSMDGFSKLFKLADSSLKLRKLEEKDVKICCQKLNKYTSQFKINIELTEEEFRHKFLPRPNVVDSLVLENKNKEVTDFISFFYIPSLILDNPKIKEVDWAYLYYYFNESVSLKELVGAGLHFLKSKNIDVLTCLDQMNNLEFVEELKFRKGSNYLYFYLYNWQCPNVTPKDIGLVIV